MKPFPLFFSQIPKIFWETVQMAVEEVYQYAHVTTKLLEVWQHLFNVLGIIFILFVFQ